jgi:hypothetical protein
MGKHTGQAHRDLDKAIDNAADQALRDAGPGTYVIDKIDVNVHVGGPGAAPGTNPIRDYIVTLAGP